MSERWPIYCYRMRDRFSGGPCVSFALFLASSIAERFRGARPESKFFSYFRPNIYFDIWSIVETLFFEIISSILLPASFKSQSEKLRYLFEILKYELNFYKNYKFISKFSTRHNKNNKVKNSNKLSTRQHSIIPVPYVWTIINEGKHTLQIISCNVINNVID